MLEVHSATRSGGGGEGETWKVGSWRAAESGESDEQGRYGHATVEGAINQTEHRPKFNFTSLTYRRQFRT
jgi:hypothetical protein